MTLDYPGGPRILNKKVAFGIRVEDEMTMEMTGWSDVHGGREPEMQAMFRKQKGPGNELPPQSIQKKQSL
jgi:hypothetical protein